MEGSAGVAMLLLVEMLAGVGAAGLEEDPYQQDCGGYGSN